jgi:hypothetical protein
LHDRGWHGRRKFGERITGEHGNCSKLVWSGPTCDTSRAPH